MYGCSHEAEAILRFRNHNTTAQNQTQHSICVPTAPLCLPFPGYAPERHRRLSRWLGARGRHGGGRVGGSRVGLDDEAVRLGPAEEEHRERRVAAAAQLVEQRRRQRQGVPPLVAPGGAGNEGPGAGVEIEGEGGPRAPAPRTVRRWNLTRLRGDSWGATFACCDTEHPPPSPPPQHID
jgi:hypothetical protein